MKVPSYITRHRKLIMKVEEHEKGTSRKDESGIVDNEDV